MIFLLCRTRSRNRINGSKLGDHSRSKWNTAVAEIIRPTKAKELILTAKRITADEAFRLGILYDVVERNELLNKAMKLAEGIMKNAPIAVRKAKLAINNDRHCFGVKSL